MEPDEIRFEADGDHFKCRECGAQIMAAHVHHPVRFKGMGLAGGGEVQLEIVPYCPTCDEEPSPYGKPIYV